MENFLSISMLFLFFFFQNNRGITENCIGKLPFQRWCKNLIIFIFIPFLFFHAQDDDKKEQLWIKEPFSRIMNKKWPGYIGRKTYESCMLSMLCMLVPCNGTNYEHTKTLFMYSYDDIYFPSLLYTHVQTIIEFMGYWMIYQQ